MPNLNCKKRRVEGLSCKNKINPKKKRVFDLAKHGLNKHGFKDQNWSHVLGEERNRRGRREKGEKKRKRKRKKMEEPRSKKEWN